MGSDSTLGIIARRWYVVLTVMIVAGGVAWLLTERMGPQYTATSTLRVEAAPGSDLPYRLDYADRFANSLATLAESPWMSRALTESLGVPPETRVVAELPANTDVITLSVTLPNPMLAAEAANQASMLLVELSTQGSSSSDAAAPGTLVLRQFDSARPPASESGPGLLLVIGIASLLGLVVGSVLAAAAGGRAPASYTAQPVVSS